MPGPTIAGHLLPAPLRLLFVGPLSSSSDLVSRSSRPRSPLEPPRGPRAVQREPPRGRPGELGRQWEPSSSRASQELERRSHGRFRDDRDGQMRDGPWQSASSSKAPTHQPLPQPAWRPSLSPSREYARPGPSQLRRRSRTPPLSSGPPPSRQDPPSPPQPEATPLLSRLGPAPTPFPQGSVAPTASVAPSVSDVSTPWPPPECLRLAQWYALDIAGVDGQEDPLTWVHQNSHLGVLAARRVKPIRKKGAMYHMYLLFKDVAKRDSCRSVLVSSCGGKTLLPFLYTDTLVNCFGVAEVRYMQEVYINAISTAEIQELLAVGPTPYATAR
ncbi:hypothetical protein BS47DRAFT_1369505 [Hydnum rufescens UP504]|uniref:Uncharacterized protein n=1 Tax=Hydnum rufescens UP504 TaxID=1448309 RepID=A0A9P6DME9_9AGAM|nr:hypothetical protein BS47DRAFT_1369505 [Hydnum rufescens UP504]